MKTIIVLTDTVDGGVNVNYMTEMTVEEAARGMQPSASPGYRCALQFQEHFNYAKELALEKRVKFAEMAESLETEQEAARCWH